MMGMKKNVKEPPSPPNRVPETRKRPEEEENQEAWAFLFTFFSLFLSPLPRLGDTKHTGELRKKTGTTGSGLPAPASRPGC